MKPLPKSLSNVTSYRVIYGDTDQMGVVYYANYLRYFEAGRNEIIRAKGLRYREIEAAPKGPLPLVEAPVSYQRPAPVDHLNAVQVGPGEMGAASGRIQD